MKKLVLFSAVSIDGFIAGEGDNLDWLTSFGEADVEAGADYEAFDATVDVAIMGNSTYEFVLKEGFDNPYPDKKSYVFTRTAKEQNRPVTYVSGDIVEFVKGQKQGDGKDIWLVGGGAINAIMLAGDLVDELKLDIIPVTVGKGVRLFEGDSDFKDFELVSATPKVSGRVSMHYKRK